jgi:nickel-dependent lactate racemase
MQLELAYGRTGLCIEAPDDATVITPTHLPGLSDPRAAVVSALRAPIGAPPLWQTVKATDKVCVVISDITRPTPNDLLVPWLLEELDFVPRENFVILNGTGSHRDNTREELIGMLGREVVETVRVVNNHAREPEEQVHLGQSPTGAEVWLNREYVEADVRIATGFIEPHFFAGFSGGPKGIMPAVAGIETILHFHSAPMIGDPRSTWGVLDGNPVQEETTAIVSRHPPEFLLNVTLNGEKEITGVFAGDWLAAHRAGCAFVKEHAMVAVDAPFDVVVTTNSGYPLDQNLYQAVKGMSAAQRIVKRGGVILCAAECSDGLPDHGNYGKILGMRDTPAELLAMIEDPAFQMFDQWQVQKQAMVQTWANVGLTSSLPDEAVRAAHFTPVHDISAALADYAAQGARIALMPLGPLTIPYLV